MARQRGFAIALLGVAALGASVLPSALAQAPALNGTWRLASDPAQTQAAVQQQAIEPAIARLAPDIQRLARARIAETTWVPLTITIQATAAQISVQYRGAEDRTFATAPGERQNVYSRSGVRAQLTQTYRPDGGIQQEFVALDGTQINTLVPDPSGRTLYLDVTMRSPRLQGEIRFRITYGR